MGSFSQSRGRLSTNESGDIHEVGDRLISTRLGGGHPQKAKLASRKPRKNGCGRYRMIPLFMRHRSKLLIQGGRNFFPGFSRENLEIVQIGSVIFKELDFGFMGHFQIFEDYGAIFGEQIDHLGIQG